LSITLLQKLNTLLFSLFERYEVDFIKTGARVIFGVEGEAVAEEGS
jgi:hypothetical protein